MPNFTPPRIACGSANQYLACGAGERSGRGSGCFADIALGLVGAVVGGWLFSHFGHHDPMRFNLVSMVIAIMGAVIVLLIWHAITGRGLRR